MKTQKQTKSCLSCKGFGYIGDSRGRPIVCSTGLNYDYKICSYRDIAAWCQRYKSKFTEQQDMEPAEQGLPL